jgi:hypothetical protein
MSSMNDSLLNAALRHFEAAEANLVKLEKIWTAIWAAIPEGIIFGEESPDYENNCRSFRALWVSLPKIDGWKPDIVLMDLDGIAQCRLDAEELGEFEIRLSVARQISEPSRLLREYRYRLNQKRRELMRDALMDLIDSVDRNLRELSKLLKKGAKANKHVDSPLFEELKNNVAQINTLLGSSVSRPARWSDLHRHLHFRLLGDLDDIIEHDWPAVKAGLRTAIYGEKEPIPVEVEDLGALTSRKPRGPVATKLHWEYLSEEDFERLVFALISSEQRYENPRWLTRTNAPDRGRDLSVYRVHEDPLGGTIRQRVIIQCKHWLSKSVGPTEVAKLREQMKM